MTDSERHEDNYKRWNVESLKEYFDLAIANLEEKIEQKFCSVKESVNKAESAHDRRLDSMNEFREQLRDQQQTFVEKSTYMSDLKNLNEKINDLKDKLQKIENIKEGGNLVWAYVASAISLIIAIVSVTINLLK